jgi:hypothetical protein
MAQATVESELTMYLLRHVPTYQTEFVSLDVLSCIEHSLECGDKDRNNWEILEALPGQQWDEWKSCGTVLQLWTDLELDSSPKYAKLATLTGH